MIAHVVCLAAMAACALASPAGPVKKYTETFTAGNGEQVSFDMLLIDGGEFVMGSPRDETGRQDHEGLPRKVRVDSFYLCPTETTLELFLAYYEETNRAKVMHAKVVLGVKDVDAITGPTPVFGELTMGYAKNHPAMAMTWHNVQTFCRWLSKKTNKTYRLPTEAEWEYAARAGGPDMFGAGNDAQRVGDWAWYDDNADGETHPVAAKKPNAWGLYDMSGNVREWVFDFYSPTAYAEAAANHPVVNPQGPGTGKVHVARGGDYNSLPAELRCAARAFEEKWWRSGDPQIPKSRWWLPNMDFIGFRLARSVDKQQTENAPAGHKFIAGVDGEYTFDTGVLRGKLRQGGKSQGLSSVVHVASGTRLDGGVGIFGPYRIFTTNKRYGTAAWNLPSESKLLDDGAVEVTWPAGKDRPFELVAVYHFSGDSTLDVETIVRARDDLSNFEVFMASYFARSFPTPCVYAAPNPAAKGSSPFVRAVKSSGDWQMFPGNEKVAGVIRDGRWLKEPNPVNWAIMPCMRAPIGLRRGTTVDLTAILISPANDCFAIATPYEAEGHYSMYLCLFGRDIKAGRTARARSRFVVADAPSDAEVVDLYRTYMKDIADGAVKSHGP